jgi:hypothetical protein
VSRKAIISAATVSTLGACLIATSAHAFMGFMNPGEWFDDNDDDYYRYGRWGGPYGGYGPYGYGGPYGGYGPYGYGGPWGGGYGPYGYGGYNQPSTIVVNPSSDQPAPRIPE